MRKHAPGGDTLAQESVLPIETPEASAPEQARQLVRYFHRCFHQNDIVIPTTKELEFAAALIAEHGMKTSRFVVEYSVEEAATTKYSPAMLVGIRQYVDAAIKKWDAREAQRQKEKLKAREAQLKEQYERYRDHEIDRIKFAMPPAELAELESSIRAELKAQGIKQFTFEMEMRTRRDKQLASRAGVLPYEKWREQQGTA